MAIEDGVGAVDEIDRDLVGFEREGDGGCGEGARGERARERDAVGEIAFAREKKAVERNIASAGVDEFDPVDGVAGGEVDFVQAHRGGDGDGGKLVGWIG